MTDSWVEGFNSAMLRFLQTYQPEAVEIISYQEDTGGGCETCGPDIEVDFRYKCGDPDCDDCKPVSGVGSSTGRTFTWTRGHVYRYWGSLGSVIESITS